MDKVDALLIIRWWGRNRPGDNEKLLEALKVLGLTDKEATEAYRRITFGLLT